jgi:predicted metal-dependent peptidase
MHVALLHITRLKGRNRKKWNMAADFVINLMLVERGFTMPKGGLLDKSYAGLSTEQVYDLIPDQQAEDYPMDIEEAPGDLPAMEEGIKEILVRASVASKMAGDKPGSIPGDIQIYLDKLLKPKLPWKVILRRFIQSFAKDDYTFTRPNRRFFTKHNLPALKSEKLIDLAIAVDTSGSVTDEEFKRFVSETSGILKMMQPDEMTLIQFDTKLKSIDTLKNLQDLSRVTFTGRGGTKIGPVLEWAKEAKPQLLLVFSDGEFYWPGDLLKNPTLWMIHNNKDFKAPFGQVIHYEV